MWGFWGFKLDFWHLSGMGDRGWGIGDRGWGMGDGGWGMGDRGWERINKNNLLTPVS
ncbi:MAG UNVERIFIED_CONTAM: hypothetical protein LVR29_22115 [Microcystis novacekii LVE1205-3]